MNHEEHELEALRDEVEDLVGVELIIDYTQIEDGRVVNGYIAQADVDKGITICGQYAYSKPENHGNEDIDLVCINRNHIGCQLYDFRGTYTYDLTHYLRDIRIILQQAKVGVRVRKPGLGNPFGSNIECAFT